MTKQDLIYLLSGKKHDLGPRMSSSLQINFKQKSSKMKSIVNIINSYSTNISAIPFIEMNNNTTDNLSNNIFPHKVSLNVIRNMIHIDNFNLDSIIIGLIKGLIKGI